MMNTGNTDELQFILADTQYLIVTAMEKILNGKSAQIIHATTKSELQACLDENPGALVIIDPSHVELLNAGDIKDFISRYVDAKFMVLTNSLNAAELNALMDAGIKNILLKTADADDFLNAVDATAKGKKYFSEEVLDLLIEAKSRKPRSNGYVLTFAEMEIVRMIAEGYTAKEIASRKNISFHTVMSHRKNIFKKLGVNSVSGLIMHAVKAGWIDNIEYYI